MKRRKVRTLWGQQFDIVNDGLAEHQITTFVEDLLKRYNNLLKERKYRESLRLLAERKVELAEKIAASVLQQARSEAGKGEGQGSQVPLVENVEETSSEGEPRLEAVTDDQPAETTAGLDSEAPASEGSPDRMPSEYPSAKGPSSTPSPYEIDIQLQPPKAGAESLQVTTLIDSLERSKEVSVKGYQWFPSSGWVITVSVPGGRLLTPLLLEIPEIEGVSEVESDAEASNLPSHPEELDASPEAGQTPRKRVRVWLKEPDVRPEGASS